MEQKKGHSLTRKIMVAAMAFVSLLSFGMTTTLCLYETNGEILNELTKENGTLSNQKSTSTSTTEHTPESTESTQNPSNTGVFSSTGNTVASGTTQLGGASVVRTSTTARSDWTVGSGGTGATVETTSTTQLGGASVVRTSTTAKENSGKEKKTDLSGESTTAPSGGNEINPPKTSDRHAALWVWFLLLAASSTILRRLLFGSQKQYRSPKKKRR